MPTYQTLEDEWRAFLTGTHPGLTRGRRFYRLIPSHPRCKWCNAPFGRPGKFLSALVGKRPAAKNPNFCNTCFTTLKPGGAEIELSFLFADVRGSTTLAETMGPAAFRNLLNRFYTTAADILIESDALVDKFVGDEVIGLYLPALSGPDHARRAIEAARELLRRTGHGASGQPWLPIGAGVHTGIAFVGTVGDAEGVKDLTALGDAVNTTARLASAAAQGEVLVTEAALVAARFDGGAFERRELVLKGKSETVTVRVVKI